MDIMQGIYEKAAQNPQRVAFPEACEEKILLAVKECVARGLIRPVLVGVPADIKVAAGKYGVNLDGVEIVDSSNEVFVDVLIEDYLMMNDMLSAKALKRRTTADPMFTAMIMLALGKVDCAFAGIVHTTGDVIAAGQLIVGLKEGVTTVSSIGIFDIPGYEGSEGQLLAFGDSAVCVNPSAEELASIAISACETVTALLDWDARCGMLSYSTDGAAESDLVEKVREAVKIANKSRPDLKIDGEFQLDAAIVPAVAAKKVKRDSAVAGKANIIIWPDLNVGNVGVKLVQQFGKADAYGPLLQGFARSVCDCSRSAPVSEIVGNIAIAAVCAQGKGK